jgi:hypothetical protein
VLFPAAILPSSEIRSQLCFLIGWTNGTLLQTAAEDSSTKKKEPDAAALAAQRDLPQAWLHASILRNLEIHFFIIPFLFFSLGRIDPAGLLSPSDPAAREASASSVL